MLDIEEFDDVTDTVEQLDAIFTDDVINKAEYYDLSENPTSLTTTLTLYNDKGEVILTAEVDDYDVAEVYLEETFDLEENDPEETDSQMAATTSPYGHANKHVTN